ncbi:hypothetical protein ACLKA7_009357 [Drosophila subpalustris]
MQIKIKIEVVDKDENVNGNGNVDDWLLFVLNHLAKCQTYFMLGYSAYASVCHLDLAVPFAIRSGSVSGIAIETILHSAPEALKVQQQRDLFASHRRRQLRPRSLFCSPSKLLHLIVDVDVIVDVFAARFVALDTEILSCETASNTRFHL